MRKLLISALFIATPLLLHADVVELTTGEKLEGKVIARDESGVTLKVPYGLIIIENKFVKSVMEDDSIGKKKSADKDPEKKNVEKEKAKLRSRVQRWMGSRNKLVCKKCGGDGKSKCRYCNGTGQQPADPHGGAMRG